MTSGSGPVGVVVGLVGRLARIGDGVGVVVGSGGWLLPGVGTGGAGGARGTVGRLHSLKRMKKTAMRRSSGGTMDWGGRRGGSCGGSRGALPFKRIVGTAAGGRAMSRW